MIKTKDKDLKTKRFDKILLIITLLLLSYGTAMVISAGSAYAQVKYGDAMYFVKRQMIWLIVGLVAMLIASKIDISYIKKASIVIYVASLVLLILTLVIGFTGNGAQRWISIGPLTIQPSEIAKLSVVLMLSYYFDKYEIKATSAKGSESFIYGTMLPLLIILVPIILVMLQKHLSCIIILGMIGVILILLAGVRIRYIAGFIGVGAAGIAALALFTDYTKDRITVWLDPEKYKLTGGWQTLQGLMAIGSGGYFGKGYGMSELKHLYVSEPANDMIFAILCEELGIIGALVAIGLFASLIYRGFRIAENSKGTYQRILCLGISCQIAIQTLLNIAVVTNTIPNTGISLPFFSYGGSSLVMLLFEIGLILSVSRHAKIGK